MPLHDLITIKPNNFVRFKYKNHRGETRIRSAIVIYFQLGVTPYHGEEPQFFLHAFDIEKNAPRSFAVKDISELAVVWR